MGRVFVFCIVSISRCMGCCYPTTSIGQDFCRFYAVITSKEAKMLSLKMGLPSLGVYYLCVSCCKDCYPTNTCKDFLIFFPGFTHHNGKVLYFACKCKQLYALLHHHCFQEFFALVICWVTSNEANTLRFKISLPSLRVTFSHPRHFLVIKSCHQNYC